MEREARSRERQSPSPAGLYHGGKVKGKAESSPAGLYCGGKVKGKAESRSSKAVPHLEMDPG